MEQLPWPAIGSGAGYAAFMVLAFLVLRAVVKGDWIPRATHEREVNAAHHEANEWRAEGRIKDQAILVELGQIKTTAEETGKTLHHFLSQMQRLMPGPRKEGD